MRKKKKSLCFVMYANINFVIFFLYICKKFVYTYLKFWNKTEKING